MKKTLKLLALASVLSALSVAAKADPLAFTATLVGTQEVPANSSPGVGNALVTVDGNMMTVNVTFSGLIGNTTVAHIHCCVPPGVNAIVATTTPTFMGFPAGVTAGTYMRTLDLTLASNI